MDVYGIVIAALILIRLCSYRFIEIRPYDVSVINGFDNICLSSLGVFIWS